MSFDFPIQRTSDLKEFLMVDENYEGEEMM
jgi:hypothetical protein